MYANNIQDEISKKSSDYSKDILILLLVSAKNKSSRVHFSVIHLHLLYSLKLIEHSCPFSVSNGCSLGFFVLDN